MKRLTQREPLVSVMIPVFNVEDYLEECIDSVIRQSYQNLEIVLVDDGSTDSSGLICKQYADVDERIVYVHQENQGLSAARNAGIEIVRGDYLLFVDSDDALKSNCIEALVGCLDYADGCICCTGFFTERSKLFSDTGPLGNRVYTKRDFYYQMVSNHSCGKLYPSRWFLEYGIRFPVGRNYEDVATTYKLVEKSAGIIATSKPLYYYRQRSNGIAQTFSEKNISDLFSAYSEIAEHYDGDDSDAVRYYLLSLLNTARRSVVLSDLNQERKTELNSRIKRSIPPKSIQTVLRHIDRPLSIRLLLFCLNIDSFLIKIKHRINV